MIYVYYSSVLRHLQALKLITETFSLGLTNIFNYYIAKAHLRRNNAVSAEKMKHKELLRQSGHLETDREAVALVISPARLQNLQYLKNLMKTQREMISYKEYLQVSTSTMQYNTCRCVYVECLRQFFNKKNRATVVL